MNKTPLFIFPCPTLRPSINTLNPLQIKALPTPSNCHLPLTASTTMFPTRRSTRIVWHYLNATSPAPTVSSLTILVSSLDGARLLVLKLAWFMSFGADGFGFQHGSSIVNNRYFVFRIDSKIKSKWSQFDDT
jgi:hypothetical protein